MHLFLQMSKLQETTSYFDENAGRVGVKSDTVPQDLRSFGRFCGPQTVFAWDLDIPTIPGLCLGMIL